MISDSYVAARARFRAAARSCGAELEEHPIEARGPGGEILTVDAALGGDVYAPATLVVSCGLHGIEGFFGSAIQAAVFDHWTVEPPAGVRWVFLHALNPFGFAWLRRANEDNVDPNRNLLAAGEEYHGSPPGYREFDGLLNPRRPPGPVEFFFLRSAWSILRYGMPAMKQAVAGGQYEFPRGLFYGGGAPSRMMTLLEEHLPRWTNGASAVLHLDFHTGLGRWATWKLLADYPLSPAAVGWLEGAFGAESVEESSPQGVAYVTRGSLGQWCCSTFAGRDYTYLCAEFGTYSPLTVLAGLRAENQAHHWGRSDSRSTRRAKEKLREVFCPRSPGWRRKVLLQGTELVERAAERLARSPQLLSHLPDTEIPDLLTQAARPGQQVPGEGTAGHSER